ncbi:MAG: thiamine-phosphate kinase [Planctomycetes bacterium]|nr:thiamine-phosphate kinase [Planctomycetota bacterium]
MEKSEDQLIAWIASRFPRTDLPIGIGDDMAMLPGSAAGYLVTSDMLMDGVDFKTTVHSPELIGRKALAVSLSDCAAMAVCPRFAMVSVALPNAWTMEQAKGLYIGIEALAKEYNCLIVGGDTNSWDYPLVIDVTVLAEPWPEVSPVRRTGAKVGDLICVTGELGGSIAGRHITFTPRVREAKWLAERLGGGLHAMMDLSDGLSVDAARMAKASGVGLKLWRELTEATASHDAELAARADGRSVLDHVLNDGEDFELLLTVDAKAWKAFMETPEGGDVSQKFGPMRVRVIGEVIAERGLWLEGADKLKTPITPRGWRHFTA